jgi:hypothetical protein
MVRLLFSQKGGTAIKKLPRRFWSAISVEIGKPLSPVGVSAEALQKEVQKLFDLP